jgi:hypothetical protein
MKINTGATYDMMPPLDGAVLVEEYEDPAANKARLTLKDTNNNLVCSFEFTGGRGKEEWSKRGVPPVVWHYVPPTRDRPPQVWIAVDRLTAISETPPKGEWCWFWMKKRPSDILPKFPSVSSWRGGGGCGCHTGHHVAPTPKFSEPVIVSKYDEYDRVDLKPKVTIFRVQNPSLMPDPLDPTTIMSCIGEPHIILPGDNAEAIDKGAYDVSGELDFKKLTEHKDRSEITTGILVLPQPQGVVFQALNNWFFLTIELKDKNRPGCFAYQVLTSGATKVFFIEHDGNIKIEVTTIDAPSTKPILVFARLHGNSGNVPAQGAKIQFVKDSFKQIDVPDTSKTSLVLATQLVVETLMGFVPVIGDLYQFGQLAFMCATGKDFWGHKVSSAEIVLYGALSLVGSGAPILMNRAAMRSSLKAIKGAESIAGAMQAPNGVALATLREADEVILQVGGNRTAREISVIGQAQREKILEPVLDAVTAGGDAVKAGEKAAELLKEGLAAAIKADKNVANAIDDIRAAAMLTGDGKNFQNQYLRFEYDKYLMKAGSERKGPLEWLAQGSRNPWVDKYCKTLFGKDYKAAIRGSLERSGVPGTMTAKHIELYDKLIGKGVGNYGQMGREARKVAGFGQFFELDHIIEQRFLKRFKDYTDAYAKGQALGTFLVPKNAAVAAEMVKVAKDSHLITYVHVVKTRMLSQRIPFGAEHLFNVQQIADATLYTLQKLGARSYLDIEFLKTDFELLAQAMKQEAPIFRTAAELTEDLFTAAKGWPQVKCDNWGRAIF